jgi:hypothetical protein
MSKSSNALNTSQTQVHTCIDIGHSFFLSAIRNHDHQPPNATETALATSR